MAKVRHGIAPTFNYNICFVVVSCKVALYMVLWQILTSKAIGKTKSRLARDVYIYIPES